MKQEPMYSLVYYYTELYENDIENLIDYLDKGILVHLFLRGTLENELDLNDIFDLYIKNNLLFIYENEKFSEENENIAVDGIILNNKIYNEIQCRKNTKFNYNQYEIVTANFESNIIVASGAGTGKTTTMINRLMYLRKTLKDFTFDKCVLITFTNKASGEMRKRLINVLEKYYEVTKEVKYLDMMDEVLRCNISTIHVFAKKLINKYGKSIGVNENIKVRSFKYLRKKAITEALDYIYKERKDLYDVIKYYPLYEIEDKILTLWDKIDNYSIDINSSNYKVDFGKDDKGVTELVKVILQYAEDSLKNNKEYGMEISDLIKKLSYKELFNNIQDDYKLMMIDEFQDSDNIQIDFATNFCKATNCNLFVVGDEKQSIYRFRGAEHNSFIRLKEKLKHCRKPLKEFSMTRNYRTNSDLLQDINEIFINIDEKVDRFNYKERDYIFSKINEGDNCKIDYLSINELNEDYEQFFSRILENKKKDEYVAVLFRTNNDVKDFKEFCDRHSIPCRVDVSGGFYRHEAVRDFYVMIKALIDISNNGVKYSFIETPYIGRKINKQKILIDNVEDRENYFNKILEENNWYKYIKDLKKINILKLINNIVKDLNPIKKYYVRELLLAKKNKKNYKNIAYVKTLEYKLNLEYLLYLINENFSENITSILQIEEFLKLKIATDNIIDIRKPQEQYDKEFLQCLTVHKAKGLEYDYVIIPKLTNSFMKNNSVDVILRNDKDDINVGFLLKLGDDEYKNSYYIDYLKDEKYETIGEEARVLYVAMTRCKKKLYINLDSLSATQNYNSWKGLIGGAKKYD